MSVECWTGDHAHNVSTMGVPGILVYGIGIPLFALFVVWRDKHRLADPDVMSKVGFLYKGFHMQFWWWEIWVMMRKTAIAFIAVFLTSTGYLAQGQCMLGVLMGSIVVHQLVQPYTKHQLNNLELVSLVSSTLSIYLGIFLGDSTSGNSALQVSLSVILVLINCGTIALFMWVFSVAVYQSERGAQVRTYIKRGASHLTHSLSASRKNSALSASELHELGIPEVYMGNDDHNATTAYSVPTVVSINPLRRDTNGSASGDMELYQVSV
eukprot:TRINITY_DN11934_c0_g1::TRINITY_DN11934_c0_g1_i1::g.16924::m.16924 TRINITY_DN11934_c0_g1::TRINITY_DN11934_c0_g1_i1::g.16924  ORF type:complete len:294 (-),score=83.00,TRP/PF06011.7/0.003 TRINITY_DN11934_c0_g1_i1:252-1052(-)